MSQRTINTPLKWGTIRSRAYVGGPERLVPYRCEAWVSYTSGLEPEIIDWNFGVVSTAPEIALKEAVLGGRCAVEIESDEPDALSPSVVWRTLTGQLLLPREAAARLEALPARAEAPLWARVRLVRQRTVETRTLAYYIRRVERGGEAWIEVGDDTWGTAQIGPIVADALEQARDIRAGRVPPVGVDAAQALEREAERRLRAAERGLIRSRAGEGERRETELAAARRVAVGVIATMLAATTGAAIAPVRASWTLPSRTLTSFGNGVSYEIVRGRVSASSIDDRSVYPPPPHDAHVRRRGAMRLEADGSGVLLARRVYAWGGTHSGSRITLIVSLRPDGQGGG